MENPSAGSGSQSTQEWSITAVSLTTMAGMLAIVLYGFTAASFLQGVTAIAVGLAVAGASLLVGGLAGFLFGIPRSQKAQPADHAAPAGGTAAPATAPASAPAGASATVLYAPNTNLEEISDWLTKILVGVSLTQIAPIFGFIEGVGTTVAATYGKAPGAHAFSVALVIYFAVAGFIIGYLWTSLYLGRALTEAQQTVVLKKKLSALEQQTAADALALQLVQAQLAPAGGPAPGQDDLNAAMIAASQETRAHIFYRAHTVYDQNWRNDAGTPAVERTIPVFQALIASDRDGAFHRNYAILAYGLMHKPDPDWEGARAALSKAIEIRDKNGEKNWLSYEANRAMCLIQSDKNFKNSQPTGDGAKAAILADLKTALSDSWVRGWLADELAAKQWATLNGVNLAELA